LGYRITDIFSLRCMNRLFDEPTAVFDERMLQPELQGMEDYADGINNIVEAQQKVALRYFEDGSVDAAIPPLKILLHIMAYGTYEGKEISDAKLRKYFDRDYVVNSDWYKDRLELKQQKDINFYATQIDYLKSFISDENNTELVTEMDINARLHKVVKLHETAKDSSYVESLVGTIGADPLFRK